MKKSTLEYAVYKAVDKLITEKMAQAAKLTSSTITTTIENQTYQFTAKLVYIGVKEELEGEYKDESKDQSFETPLHGKVSHKVDFLVYDQTTTVSS